MRRNDDLRSAPVGNSDFHVTKSMEIYSGHVINVRVDSVARPTGGAVDREVVEHAGAVVIVALDSEGRVSLVRQYRHPVGRSVLELPAGTVEENENPIDTAKRELREEVGLVARRWVELGRFFSSPGFSNEEIRAYLARDLRSVPVAPEDDEDIVVSRQPLIHLVDNPERIEDAKTLGAVLLLERFLERERIR